jgi:fibronectin type 3 domain-containing protein
MPIPGTQSPGAQIAQPRSFMVFLDALSGRCIGGASCRFSNFNSASEKRTVSSVRQAIVSVAFLLTASLAYAQSSTKSSMSPAGSVSQRPPHSVTLTWARSASVQVTGYNIYRSRSKGGPYRKIYCAVGAGTSYVDSDVLAGQTYYYVVTAVNQRKAESHYSAEAHAKVPNP